MKPNKPLIGGGVLALIAFACVQILPKMDLPRLFRGADDALSTLDNRPTRGLAHLCTGSSDTGPDGLRDSCNPTERRGKGKLGARGLIGLACNWDETAPGCRLHDPSATLTLTAPEELPKHLRELRAIFDIQKNPEK